MTKRWYYSLILILLSIIGFAIYIAQNTDFNLSGSSLENGQATFETDFPNATCRKVLQFGFPPLRLECKENPRH